MADYESKEIEWEGPEFEYKHKDVSWYWVSIIIATAFVGFAAWQKNFLFGFFVLVAEILVLAWGNQKPATFHFRLTEKGLFIGDKKDYRYVDMETFSCYGEDGSDFENIVFKFKKHLARPVKIILPKNLAKEVREVVATKIKEVDHEPSLIDSIEEFIGF